MKSNPHCLALAMSLAAGSAMAQPTKADCAAAGDTAAYRAYLILDQSRKSDAFREALKNLHRPDLVAFNTMKGDFSRVGANAERHPLAFVYGDSGTLRKIEDPTEFVRVLNGFIPCPNRPGVVERETK